MEKGRNHIHTIVNKVILQYDIVWNFLDVNFYKNFSKNIYVLFLSYSLFLNHNVHWPLKVRKPFYEKGL